MDSTTNRTHTQSGAKKPTHSTVPQLFNPFEPQFYENPYPYYELLRTRDPVHRSPFGVWFAGRYADVRSILKDRRFRAPDIPALLRRKSKLFATTTTSSVARCNLDQLISNAEYWPAFLEAPDHMRLRGALTNALTRSNVELLRPFVRSAARSLIDTHLPRGEMDVLKDFAHVLPIIVISHMLGVPHEMCPVVQTWTGKLARILDSLTSPDELNALNNASREFAEYLRELIAERKRNPRSDLISALCAERSEGDQQLTEQELISTCTFVFMAGSDAIAYFLGNAVLALIKHPRELQYLRENLSILPSAIDELLRFDAPLQMITRTALEDVDIRGIVIRAGEQVYLALGSANRDPERFEKPDDLILERQHNHHMAFGDGHHMCVGAQLARIEGQEALRALIEMIPGMRLATDNLQWRRQLLSRGLMALPIHFTAN